MRILITGVLGFIGSRLATIASNKGHTVFGIDACKYSARVLNLPTYIPWALCDVVDAGQVGYHLDTFNPDIVMHLAAETHVARSIESRDEFLRTNVLGTNVMLEECLKYWKNISKKAPSGFTPLTNDVVRQAKFRFIHVSTDEVYGSLTENEPAWTEDSPFLPNNPYSASKAAADCLVRAYWNTYKLPVITTHCGNNYGPAQHPEKLIPTLVSQCIRGEAMTIHGDGKNIRDWIHVDDHCEGLLAAAKHGFPGETYNFGAHCERSNIEIANLVGTATNHNHATRNRLEFIVDRPGNDRRYAIDPAKAHHDLMWSYGRPIDYRIAETVRWYIDNSDYSTEYWNQG